MCCLRVIEVLVTLQELTPHRLATRGLHKHT
jgi:hypothetical protein